MGWLIETKKEKYRIYSTVVDAYISGFMDKDELVRFLFWHKFERLIKETLEDMITFPNGWTDKKTDKIMNCDKNKHDELSAIIKDRKNMYHQFLAKTKEVGIFLCLKDINGVNLHNEPLDQVIQ